MPMLLLANTAMAQHSVKLMIDLPAAEDSTKDVYVAGSFNGWNPRDETFRLRKDDKGNYTLQLMNVPAGEYEFKFTRGGWEAVETDAQGQHISNRKLNLTSDTTLRLSIAGWASGEAAPRMHTARPNVRIIDTAFYMPQVGRNRRIWVCLPPDYGTGNKKYPVLYMHDGQNLFDEATSFAGEWGVDEALDSMKQRCIVIGIDNGGLKRMNEYNPYDNERFGKGEGAQYIAFIAKTLKPYIDKKYRTLKDKKNTMIAGSSMGGLISMYAAITYPGVFGGAGVFSPSFWIAPGLHADIERLVKRKTHGQSRIYFYAGEQESKELVKEVLSVFEAMRMKAGCKMEVRINAEGQHNEPTWRQEFPIFYRWIMK
jgi:predicted alpha/beta superfamily hydrolase